MSTRRSSTSTSHARSIATRPFLSVPDQPDQDAPLDPSELAFAERLEQGRPVPAPRFRGVLARHLLVLDPGWGPRPPHLVLSVFAYLCLGLVLMGIGALIGIGAL